ncbi:MAG: ABC transporter permease [Prolixibacteraceae bacterium]|nr:ABC transporter permease [Prolixibacteraceae bacterium]
MKQTFLIRGFRKNSRLNLLNIFSFAVGVAAAIILLGYVYQEYHYDSQLANSDRIYQILMQNDENELIGWASYAPLAEKLKSDYPEIEDATRISFYWGNLAFTTGDKMFNESNILFADPNFFSLFSFPLNNGNALNDLNSPNFLAISKSTAKKYFGDKNPVGKEIKVGKEKLFIVQAVFNDFPSTSNFQGNVILPLEQISELTQMGIEPGWEYPSETYTFILTDKKNGIEKLSAKIENYLTNHVEENPEKLFLQSLKDIHTNKNIDWEFSATVNKKYLSLLLIVAIVILTMSAINFLMLYIGTASQRQLNIGVKKVCGATRRSIFRDQVKETLSFVLISVFASLLLIILYNYTLAIRIPRLPSITEFDSALFFRLAGLILLFVIISSFSPAIILTLTNTIYLFKTNQQVNFKKIPIVKSLIVIQFTVSIVLMAITALFYKQMHFLENYNPGFAREELITIPLNMHIGDGFFNENLDVFCQELKKQPGVKNVTLAFSSPSYVQTSSGDFRCDGMPEGKTVNLQWNSVYYDYFKTLGVNLVEGRSFSREFAGDMVDYDNGGKCVFVINRKAADEMGIADPIGKTLHGYQEGPIIGIVEDFNFKSLHSEIAPMSFDMNPFYYNQVIVRINPGVPAVLDQIETVWKQFVPDYPIGFSFVNDQMNKMYESEKRLTANLNLFSIIAIFIACIGLLSLTILAMQNRTKEIGIRKINGAKVSEILALLNKDFLMWVMFAFIVATPLARYIMHKWLDNFAYKTSLSWWLFALAGLMALAIALFTVSFQSFKAATRNPVEALRYE